MSLPRVAEPHTPDVSGLSIGLALTPPSVTGKRVREEDWHPAELDILKMILARPPRDDLHYPPGALPPPDVLDELATFIIVTYRHASVAMEDSSEPSPSGLPRSESESDMSDDADASFSTDSGYPLRAEGWPHTWEETRLMLTHLALEDTRWAADRDHTKLSRKERLARRNQLKRTDSRDSLSELSGSESDLERREREKLSRAQRLSNTLQASAREPSAPQAPPPLSRAVSLGGPSSAPQSRPVPTHSQGALGLGGLGLGMPMRRGGSARSMSSTGSQRRPSLLARGRSFTAQDLEDELASQQSAAAAERERLEREREQRESKRDRGRSKRKGSDTEEDEPISPISPAALPTPLSPSSGQPRLIRSLSEMSRPRASVPLNTRPGSEEPKGSPPMRGPLSFGPALDALGYPRIAPAPAPAMLPERRRSRRPTGPTLAMTAMAGAAALRSPSSNGSPLPSPIIEPNAGPLRSPFEERGGNPFH